MANSFENVEVNLGFEESCEINLVQEIEVKREKRQRRKGRRKKKDDGIQKDSILSDNFGFGNQGTEKDSIFRDNLGFGNQGTEKDSIFRDNFGFGNQGTEKDSIFIDNFGFGNKGIGRNLILRDDVDFGNDSVVRVAREGVICYTRKEMGEMRFVNEEEQRKKWVEVYCGLGPEVAEAYDGLIGSKSRKKQITVEFDPRYRRDSGSDNKLINGGSADSDISASIQNQNGHPIAEEQCCDDEDESDEEYDTILRPAFFVAGEPDFDSGPPQDGLEYLRRVRYEAAQIPKVKIVKVDKSKLMSEQTAYMPQIPEIAKCPDHLLPLKSWEDTFISDFSQLRQALSHDVNSTDGLNGEQPSIFVSDKAYIAPELSSDCIAETFKDLITGGEDDIHSSDTLSVNHSRDQITVLASHGSDTPDTIESSSCKQVVKDNNENHPTMSTILSMEPVARVSMLRKRIRSLENMSYFSKDDCLWIYALCASIDTPLDPDTSASLRSLLRKCASLRSQKTEMDDEVIMLNILATISGRYFGQLEGR